MAITATPALPQGGTIGIATLTSATPITSRANISGTTGLVQLTANPTNFKRLDSITVKSKAVSVATSVFIWLYNGTTSFLWDEIFIPAVPATGNTTASATVTNRYVDVTLPPNFQLYVSQSVASDLNVFANTADY